MTAAGVLGVPHMRSSGFTDPSFAKLGDLAHLLAGLVFPPNRQPSAEAGMRRAMAMLRISDPAELLRATESPGEAREIVIAELTVGESYFFRDAAQLNLLAMEILPSRVTSHGEQRPLRVWSAGCASGEEPYTLAIMLRELRWPHPARILGTDVAITRLNAARRARYTRWALRGVSTDRIATWFRRSGNYFDLDRSIRESVDFRTLNLAHDDIASLSPDAGSFDLVLCRNVMIYFDIPTAARIATQLLDSLDRDGWLVLGASDPPLAQLVPCDAVMTPAGMAYRRAPPREPGATPPLRSTMVFVPQTPVVLDTWAAPGPEEIAILAAIDMPPEPAQAEVAIAPTVFRGSDIRRAYDLADYPAAEALAITALAAVPEAASIWILYIRAVANQGRLREAGELCARALEQHGLVTELHSLHATLLAEAGWHADAAVAARRAIYLDRRFVMGHLLLGDALTRTGDANGARIAFGNAVTLLADADPATAIDGADGVLASRLRQIATLRLAALHATQPSQ